MAITAGGSLNSVPSPQKQALNNNYIDFTSTGSNSANWGQQYQPDLMKKKLKCSVQELFLVSYHKLVQKKL